MRTNIIAFAAIGYCFVVGLATCHAVEPKTAAAKPNIVFILADDKYEHICCEAAFPRICGYLFGICAFL